MPTFRKKPVEIEAVRVADALHAAGHAWADLPTWLADAYEEGKILFLPNVVEIVTLEGRMIGQRADWIIRGVQGELYPCKPDIFAATYETPTPAAEPTDTQRCWSCDHPADDHDDDGCTRLICCSLVTVEQADEPTFCPCASSAESARTPERDAEQAGGA